MKIKTLMQIILLFLSMKGMTQSLVEKSSFTISFGINFIDNSDSNPLPFKVAEWEFNAPFFITAEHGIADDWTTTLTLSTNKLVLAKGITKSYYSVDALANLYLGELLFSSEDFNIHIGLGAGVHKIDHETNTNLNITSGFRYWFSSRLGVSITMIGKINHSSEMSKGIGNNYQLNTGLIWRIKKKKFVKEKNGNSGKANIISRLESIENLLVADSEKIEK